MEWTICLNIFCVNSSCVCLCVRYLELLNNGDIYSTSPYKIIKAADTELVERQEEFSKGTKVENNGFQCCPRVTYLCSFYSGAALKSASEKNTSVVSR